MSETHFKRLLTVVERINRLSSTESYYGIGEARGLPGKMAASAKRVRISAGDSYGNKADQFELAAAADIHRELVERYRVKGEEAKRARLVEIATELEALRIELPHIAAKACVEIGAVARECRAEAERNHPIGDAA